MTNDTQPTDTDLAEAIRAIANRPPVLDATDVETLAAELTEGLLETLAGLGGDFEIREGQQTEDAELMLRGLQRVAWSTMNLRAADAQAASHEQREVEA